LVVDDFVFGRFGDEETYTGILTILGYSATVLIGVQSGHLLRSGMRPVGKIVVLVLAGLGCLLGGWIWETYLGFPIIKHIWTSSYTLWAADGASCCWQRSIPSSMSQASNDGRFRSS